MSSSVAKIKTLLKEGWQITSHKIQVLAREGVELEHVVLKKGNDTTFVETKNDPEFLEYMRHFEKFKDEFGNNQFVYVEDINGYKQKIENLIIRGTVPKRPYQITIGELKIDSPHLYHLVIPGFGRAHLGQAYFFVNTSKNPDLSKFDYLDNIQIKWTDTNQLAFYGFAHEVYANDNSILFLCLGGPRRFTQDRLTSELIGIPGDDALYFVAKASRMNVVIHNGSKPLLTQRSFKVLFPVAGLGLPSEFRIEQVTFTNTINNHLTPAILNSKTLQEQPWKDTKAFAVVEVIGEHFIDAMIKAEEVAKRAVDWIQFRTDLSLPCITYEGKRILLSYNMDKSFSKCFLIPYALAIDSASKGAIFNLLNVQSGHQLVFHHSPKEFFEPLIPLLDKLEQISKQYNDSVQPLYETLSWLMQSFEIESLIDNLLQLWIAFEFLCTNEKAVRLVPETTVNSCILEVQGLALPKEQEVAMVENIRRVNEPPLMVKWQALLLRVNLSLTDNEHRLVRKLRTERNNLVHGKKSSKLTIEDLDKFRSILEKVFVKKAVSLVESHYGVQNISFVFDH